ncbi:sensor histidine kinase [Desulfitobacterium chlororespirans]|uniref:histidine kinase n=1 Tax=Desulfitobacterium chlororespirans DSM 11544 TaxID=1121395 RepID=A0A1M7U733_9FIRM|nr:HAMP domain-containing sensor histidine kinase [Desulfitobacterium chlororespirans]SHN78821.1 Histidine kinase-, DNA gyrase B-, and HSP90-like ATPase [Desulfitobacterium chlororespirans DSM 11544]
MKKNIYLRTFGWLMGIWLVFMIGFSVYVLSVEKNKIEEEFMARSRTIGVGVERTINDYQDSEDKKTAIREELSRTLNSYTDYQGYEAAVYTKEGGLISSTNEYWTCQYTSHREGNTHYIGYAVLDPKKWFSAEEIGEMEEYLYSVYPVKAGDPWYYWLHIEGFWLDGAEVIPNMIRVSKVLANDFNEQEEAISGSGERLEEPIYHSDYVDAGELPYYEQGAIQGNSVFYPDGKVRLRSDERQLALREALLDKHVFEEAIEAFHVLYAPENAANLGFSQPPALEVREGFIYRFITPYLYKGTAKLREDGITTGDYWVLTANEFNILTGALPILIPVWVSCFLIFSFTAGILSTQTWKTFRSREEMEQQRRNMTNAIAHDLKTPLAVISGYAENLAENVHTEKREHYAAGIQENVRRCDRMVKDMLELSRMESGGVILALEEVSLREITEEMLSRYEDVFTAKAITLTVDGTAEVRVDRQLMERVLDNLISNAAAHTVVGGTVQVSITEERWSVTNTGFPIPAEELDLIWQAYYKLDQSRTGSGSGLGLSIVRSIMELHGFQYGAENTEAGVCFWFEW